MADLTTKVEAVPAEWAGLGGRGLTSTIVAAEVIPTCHPLGPNNKLVFAPGLLSGTAAANSGRMSCGAKSPLTGTIKESNAGGTSAQQFARMGIKALIIEGLPKDDKWYSLHVTMDGVTIPRGERTDRQGELRRHRGGERPARQEDRRAHHRSGRRDEDGLGQHLGQGPRQQDPQPRPRRPRRGHGLEEDQVHQHRRCRRPRGDHRRAGEIQGRGAHLRQGASRPPGQRRGPADLRHQRAGQHPQRGRRPADPQLHLRPVRRPRQDLRRDHARHHRRARRQDQARLPRRLHHPVLPGLHRQEGQLRHLRLRVRDHLGPGRRLLHRQPGRHRRPPTTSWTTSASTPSRPRS